MTRLTMLLAAVVLALPTGVVFAQVAPYDIQITGCQESDESFTATVTAYNDGSFSTDLHVIDENHPAPFGQCMGPVPNGWTNTITGLSMGSDVSAYYWEYSEDVRSLTMGASLPACGSSSGGARPLFNMWLLTGGGKYCILVSDTHPSIQSQKALCFPGEGWAAEQVLCKATLYSDDFWACDRYGKARLHVDDLMKYYERHQLPYEEAPLPTTDPT